MVRTWLRRRRLLRAAAFKADLADLTAKRHLAPYRAKAEIEWDLKWASPLDRTWRDELMVAVLSLPVIAWFIPLTHEYAVEGFKWLQTVDPNAPLYFLYAWGMVFVTTFGLKQAGGLLMPGRMARLVSAMSAAPDDVPDNAVQPTETPKVPGE